MICPSCGQPGKVKGNLFYHNDSIDARFCDKEGSTMNTEENITLTLPDLYPEQKEAYEYAMNHDVSMIVFPTGSGKTNIALAVVKSLNQPTIILVPTIELAKQWASFIRQYGGSCNTVFSGQPKEFTKLTIITYASMLLYLDELENYSLIIYDEVHHIFAQEYVTILNKSLTMKNRKIIGLTASQRTIGPEQDIQDRSFPNKYIRTLSQKQHSDRAVELYFHEEKITLSEQEQKQYNESWADYVLSIRQYGGFREMMQHGYYGHNSGMVAYNKIKKLLSEHPEKIRKTIEIIKNSEGNFIVFGDTIRMVDILHKVLELNGIPSVKIHSVRKSRKDDKIEQSGKAREKMLSDLREGKSRILLGCNAIEEGLDLPDMDNAIFLSNISSSSRKVIQRAGRAMRTRPGKIVNIYAIYAENTKEEDNLPLIKRTLGVD